MAGTLCVGAEGVLILPGKGSYASGKPIPEGIEMVMRLKAGITVVIVDTQDIAGAEYFCTMHGLPGVTVVGSLPEDKEEEPAVSQWYGIERQRSKGPIHTVITGYGFVYQRCVLTHQSVLLFGRRGALGSLDTSTSWEDLRQRAIRHRDAEILDAIEEEQ